MSEPSQNGVLKHELWEWGFTLLFAITQGLCSFLLFAIQPLAARILLPHFGGSPAVWIICLSFFQTALLGGYIYAHWNQNLKGGQWDRRSVYILTLLAGLCWIWMIPSSVGFLGEGSNSSGQISLHLFANISLWLGFPLLMLSASSPMLQSWLGSTRHPMRVNPYPLYSISNAASILALLSYPLIIEPFFGLRLQYRLWMIGLSIAAALLIACQTLARIYKAPARNREKLGAVNSSPSYRSYIIWILWPAVTAVYLPGITLYLSTDLLSVPLLWILPLALYLTSFVVVFSKRFGRASNLLNIFYRLFAFGSLLALIALVSGIGQPLAFFVPLHLSVFFVACLFVHGKLVESKPEPKFLTHFYMSLAAGGMMGGLFSALVAPHLFSEISEYPLAVLLVFFLSFGDWKQVRSLSWSFRLNPLLVAALIILGTAIASSVGWEPDSRLTLFAVTIIPGLFAYRSLRSPVIYGLSLSILFVTVHYSVSIGSDVIHRSRSFFGTVKIVETDKGKFRKMIHGNTLHGLQSTDPDLSNEPGSYYSRTGPAGDVMEVVRKNIKESGELNIGVVGLGVGTLSAYAQARDHWRFFELNPQIPKIANDKFSYLKEAQKLSRVDVILGDARLTLASQEDQVFDLLILDAFSSDGIPFHLLTREALDLYWKKLKSTGLIAFHISNRYFDFSKPLSVLASLFGANVAIRDDKNDDALIKSGFKTTSVWIAMSRDRKIVQNILNESGWIEPKDAGTDPWSDDHMSLLDIFKW